MDADFAEEMMVYVKKHAVALSDGRLAVAKVDVEGCADSAIWFCAKKCHLRQTNKISQLQMEPLILEELNMRSLNEFGKSLNDAWTLGKLQGRAKGSTRE